MRNPIAFHGCSIGGPSGIRPVRIAPLKEARLDSSSWMVRRVTTEGFDSFRHACHYSESVPNKLGQRTDWEAVASQQSSRVTQMLCHALALRFG